MAEEVKIEITDTQIEEAVKRVEELKKTRAELENLQKENEQHQKDLNEAETVYGVDSKEYEVQKNHMTYTAGRIEETSKKIDELTFKKSELKPIFDALGKKFEESYRSDNLKEYKIALAEIKKFDNGNFDKEKSGDGKKVYKQLKEYLEKKVKSTPRSAVSLLLLYRNMEENKVFVNSIAFENEITLKASNVKALQRFIMGEGNLEFEGFYEARDFVQTWSNCGQSISDVIGEIQKHEAETRKMADKVNDMEEEFNRSIDDLPPSEEVTIKDEVDPDVSE